MLHEDPHREHSPQSRTLARDLALRAAGLALLAVAAAALRALGGAIGSGPSALPYLLATIGFTAACSGSALLVLGGHVLDRITVAERWRPTGPRPSADSRRAVR